MKEGMAMPSPATAAKVRVQAGLIPGGRGKIAKARKPYLVLVAILAFAISYGGTASLFSRLAGMMGQSTTMGLAIGLLVSLLLTLGQWLFDGKAYYALLFADAIGTWLAYWLWWQQAYRVCVFFVASSLGKPLPAVDSSQTIVAGILLAGMAVLVAWVPERVLLGRR
jgi:hypothetical protein